MTREEAEDEGWYDPVSSMLMKRLDCGENVCVISGRHGEAMQDLTAFLTEMGLRFFEAESRQHISSYVIVCGISQDEADRVKDEFSGRYDVCLFNAQNWTSEDSWLSLGNDTHIVERHKATTFSDQVRSIIDNKERTK
jgi:hypothetical protein